MYFPAVIFGLPAFVDREYYETRFEKSKVQPNFWIRTYYESAVSYEWCHHFNTNRPLVGWKEAMKIADEKKAALRKLFDEDMKFFAEPKK